MKRHILSIACVALTLLLSGCDDWLDVKSSIQLDRDELFSSEEGYSEAIIGVYSDMANASLYGRELSFGILDVLSGRYSKIGSTYYYFQRYYYKRDNPSKNDNVVAKVDAIWTEIYELIANLNSILETIDGNKNLFTSDNYSIIKGEALGLRAFLHFELLRMYGERYTTGKDKEAIPFISELTTGVAPMLTVDEALAIIIPQLEEAVKLLVNDPMKLGTIPPSVLASLPSGTNMATHGIEMWHNRRFHFNYYAAQATLARAYLWKGDKPAALRAALAVIGVQEAKFPWVKNSNLINIGSTTSANQDRTFATEHIFALNVTDLEENQNGLLVNTTGGSNDMGSDKSVYETISSDYRYQYLFTTTYGTELLNKYYQPSVVPRYFKERIPVIRISEMYYIAAECATSTSEGVAYLENVRRNRGLMAIPLDPAMDQASLINEIQKEYAKEFAGEGQMWYYYKRTGVTSIPNMWYFNSQELFTFDRPENEDIYGNRD